MNNPFDLTNRKIKNTYHRVLQISSSDNIVRNGLGEPIDVVYFTGSIYTDEIILGDTGSNNNLILSSSFIKFDENSSIPPWQEGTLFWDSENHTYAMYNDEPDMTLQIGQELVIKGIAGEYIPNGSAVYISGSYNNYPILYLALADGTRTKKYQVIGISTHDINSGYEGYITVRGRVNDVDTSAFSDGDTLFLSNINSGSFISYPPSQPYEKVFCGHCIYSDSTNGKILVDVVALPEDVNTNVGIVDSPTITDLGGGQFTVSSGSVNLNNSPDGKGITKNYSLSEQTFVLTSSALDVNYLCACYNSGSPIYELHPTKNNINDIQNTLVATLLLNTNGNLAYASWDAPGLLLPNKLHSRISKVHGIERESGLELNISGTLGVKISSGIIWQGINRIEISSFDSLSGDNLILISNSGSNYSSSIISTYNNLQYDDGTSLQPLGNNNYTVNWVYKCISSEHSSFIMLGNEYNKFSDAVESQPPSAPPEIKDISLLIGRTIFEKGISTPEQIDSTFTQIFTPAGITEHNKLDGIQGGQEDEYYHFNLSEYNYLTELSSSQSGSIVLGDNTTGFSLENNEYRLIQTESLVLNIPQRIDTGANPTFNNLYVNTGSIGIGTDTPSYPLHVIQNGTGWGLTPAVFENTGDPGAGATSVFVKNSASEVLINAYGSGAPGYLQNGSALIASKGNRLLLGTAPGLSIMFYTNENYHNPMVVFTSDYKVGIGELSPLNKLDVAGNMVIGSSYAGVETAPTNGLLVEGNVGIGTDSPVSELHIIGNKSGATPVFKVQNNATSVAAGFELITPNLSDGGYMYFAFGKSASFYNRTGIAYNNVSNGSPLNFVGIGFYGNDNIFNVLAGGRVGIETTSPLNKLDVAGNMVIGSSYAGVETAPSNGLLVEGNVGIGKTNLNSKLDIYGDVTITGSINISSSGNHYFTGGDIIVENDITASYIKLNQPLPPTDIILTEYSSYVEINFSSSVTTDVDSYEIWRAQSTSASNYNLIGVIKKDVADTVMTVLDTSYTIKGDLFYKIYSKKTDVYSDPLTGSITTTTDVGDVTNAKLSKEFDKFYLTYDIPTDRRLNNINIKVHSASLESDINEDSSSLIYSGLNDTYIYKISSSHKNLYYQFWISTNTRT